MSSYEPPSKRRHVSEDEDKDQVFVQDKDQVFVQDKGQVPVQDKGQSSVQDKDQVPVQDKGQVPVQDKGQSSVQGEGQSSVYDKILISAPQDKNHQTEDNVGLETCLSSSLFHLQATLEACFPSKCLCSVPTEEVETYIRLSQTRVSAIQEGVLSQQGGKVDQCLLYINLLAWLGQVYHDQLSSGQVCPGLKTAVNLVLDVRGDSFLLLDSFISLLKVRDQQVQYAASQALVALLPLGQCGREETLPSTSLLLGKLVREVVGEQKGCVGDLEGGLGEFEHLRGGEEAGLGEEEENVEHLGYVEFHQLEYHAWLMSVLAGLVSHGAGGVTEDSEGGGGEGCRRLKLGEDVLCQEIQMKCLVIRAMDPVWPTFTRYLQTVLSTSFTSSSSSSSASSSSSPAAEILLSAGLTVWKSLISVRANLSFMSCRVFSADLPQVLPLLSVETPASVWRAVLDTVSECLCYGTTLGLQSIPPDEPCQLAHVIIRLVRFNSLLSIVPHRSSIGFGGQAAQTTPVQEEAYDKGLVQKMVLIVLKCVALTTREARVDSSSGESDSSLSSRESVSSCGSDMVIIERTMSGMYRLLDSWIKQVLPVLPHQYLQESVLQVLGEQDDVLIEGLLCLLDTHVALHSPGRAVPDPGLLDTNPTKGFITLLSLVSRDSSVLLDFLVSNETCFLLYFLRYLKFIVKDWGGFVSSCDGSYSEAIQMLLELKDSIGRLLNKELFPYNIGPVYRLLEKVQELHHNQKDL